MTLGRTFSLLALGAVVFTLAPVSATAVPPGTIGSFPTFTVAPATVAGLTYTGSIDFSPAVGAGEVSVSTNSSTVRTPSGESAYLGASTGFGQHFGSSRAQPYLFLSPATRGPSTTTITFSAPPPTGWGIAVGDIDADFIEVIPRDANGVQLPGSVLGAQDTDGTPLLNYCNNVPKPSTCAGAGPFTDSPFWFENGTTVGGTAYSTPIVRGNVLDTSGAYDWFLPSASVRSVDLVFHVQSGFPTYQLWLAAPAPLATVTGSIATVTGEPPPSGTVVEVERPDGSPVLDIEELPVSAPIRPDGSFEFATEQAQYSLEVIAPAEFAPIPPIVVDAFAAQVAVPPITLEPAIGPSAPGVPAPAGEGTAVRPVLPATGWDSIGAFWTAAAAAAAAAISAGVTVLLRRRITRSRRPVQASGR